MRLPILLLFALFGLSMAFELYDDVSSDFADVETEDRDFFKRRTKRPPRPPRPTVRPHPHPQPHPNPPYPHPHPPHPQPHPNPPYPHPNPPYPHPTRAPYPPYPIPTRTPGRLTRILNTIGDRMVNTITGPNGMLIQEVFIQVMTEAGARILRQWIGPHGMPMGSEYVGSMGGSYPYPPTGSAGGYNAMTGAYGAMDYQDYSQLGGYGK